MVQIRVEQYTSFEQDEPIRHYDVAVYHSSSPKPRYKRSLKQAEQVSELLEWFKDFYTALGVNYEVVS